MVIICLVLQAGNKVQKDERAKDGQSETDQPDRQNQPFAPFPENEPDQFGGIQAQNKAGQHQRNTRDT